MKNWLLENINKNVKTSSLTNQEKGRDYTNYQYQKQERGIATDYTPKIIKMNFQLQIIPKTKLQAPDGFTGKYY